MHLIRGLHNLNSFISKNDAHKFIATIGNFDGLHLGHQALIRSMNDIAEAKLAKTLVFFTEPHAAEYFADNNQDLKSPPRISSWREKFELLNFHKVDVACFLKFNHILKSMPPEKFIKEVLERVNICTLIIGDDFRFGQNRTGGFEQLKQWGDVRGIQVLPTQTVKYNSQRVSSTYIRSLLSQSNFKLARELLGRPYTFSSKVVHGNQLGRTIGVPTANLRMPKQNLPISGVFAVKCTLEKKSLFGIANMGVRPTIGGSIPVLEVHIFNFHDTIYQKRLSVEFVQKIREEKKFENIDRLKTQIAIDIKIAKDILSL
ncbi:MAG: bifunctional riboflavin kinase/FAD synthetase [Gammaproteobacteria bacterium]